jgi:hypothetical protein
VSGAAHEEAAYFQTIEEFFVSRRGDPLMLSNADWVLIRSWRKAGIPLRVVLRGIGDAMDSHALSWSRDTKVGSLRYCAAEVEVARERWALALGSGGEEGAEGALKGFARALQAARALGPNSAKVAKVLASEFEERAGDLGPAQEVETFLQSSEKRLLEALARDLGREGEEALLASIEKDLAPYRERLPPRILDQVRKDGRARRLLEAHGLPRLSLFQL